MVTVPYKMPGRISKDVLRYLEIFFCDRTAEMVKIAKIVPSALYSIPFFYFSSSSESDGYCALQDASENLKR